MTDINLPFTYESRDRIIFGILWAVVFLSPILLILGLVQYTYFNNHTQQIKDIIGLGLFFALLGQFISLPILYINGKLPKINFKFKQQKVK